jgi:hypothetical protein
VSVGTLKRANRRRARRAGPDRRRARGVGLPTALVTVLSLICAPAALAGTVSSNWAGYAVHRSGVKFRKVVGTWTQPSATCTPGQRTYSSMWVGLGGFSVSSKALEQIGTEVDCNALGKVVSTAWNELVPAPSRNIRMRVDPGDVMNASVIIDGQRVTLTLKDLTRGTTFTRTVHASPIDVTSADWIVEAPSECEGTSFCQPLALADFGTASFGRARAQTVGGHTCNISDRRWVTTKISLATQGQHFINGPYGASGAQALPSSLTAGGSAFSVVYHAPTTPPTTTSPPTSPTAGAARARPLTRISRAALVRLPLSRR